jgi:hypothetical protein
MKTDRMLVRMMPGLQGWEYGASIFAWDLATHFILEEYLESTIHE